MMYSRRRFARRQRAERNCVVRAIKRICSTCAVGLIVFLVVDLCSQGLRAGALSTSIAAVQSPVMSTPFSTLTTTNMAVPTANSVLKAIAPTTTTATATATATAAATAELKQKASAAKGTVATISLPSGDADGSTRRAMVYRPAGNDNANMPVVYFLHGYPGKYSDVFGAGIAGSIDRYVAAGGTPFVLVAPDGNSSIHDDTEWADSSDGDVKLETFITTTLIDAVEGSNRRPADMRAIAGFSMGGFGATNIAEHHPDLYGQLVEFNGYFHFDDPDDMFASHASSLTPNANAAALRGKSILLVASSSDTDLVTTGESKRFYATLSSVDIAATYVTANGGHSWTVVASQFPTMFTFLQNAWQ